MKEDTSVTLRFLVWLRFYWHLRSNNWSIIHSNSRSLDILWIRNSQNKETCTPYAFNESNWVFAVFENCLFKNFNSNSKLFWMLPLVHSKVISTNPKKCDIFTYLWLFTKKIVAVLKGKSETAVFCKSFQNVYLRFFPVKKIEIL